MRINFRPLSGNCISKLLDPDFYNKFVKISVPFRGTVFLNHSTVFSVNLLLNFRPLSGNCISKSGWQSFKLEVLNFRPLSGNCISKLHVASRGSQV